MALLMRTVRQMLRDCYRPMIHLRTTVCEKYVYNLIDNIKYIIERGNANRSFKRKRDFLGYD